MKVLSIINLKGGVGKTISAINIAHVLAVLDGKRILLIDNDKQGNTSKFFGLHDYDAPSMADVMTTKGFDVRAAIKRARPPIIGGGVLDVLPANMTLLRADKEVLLDTTRPQQTRLKKALEQVADDYDYCVIDNAPDLNMSVINALVASDDVLIPIKVDRFAFDGLTQLLEQIEEIREFNAGLRLAGCFVTMFQKNNVNREGEAFLKTRAGVPMFETVIHKTVKVDETTFAGKPLQEYAPKSAAARDYVALVCEYLSGIVTGISTNGEGA